MFRARILVEDVQQQFPSVDIYYILQYWILSLCGTAEGGKVGTIFLPAQEYGHTQNQKELEMMLKL